MISNLINRIVDLTLSIVFLIVFSPVFIVTAVAIWAYDGHFPLYHHKRVGLNGKKFEFWKFRSMVVNADDILFKNKELYKKMRSGKNKVEDDPRITPIGKFIRKYSIDEFPQVLNVLHGDMSFIGPRALRPDEFDEYKKRSRENEAKLKTMITVKPGITGLWQVSGRSDINFDQRIDLECSYAKKKSILLDIVILFKTPFAVIKGEGAY